LEGDVVISNVMVTRAITERFFEKMSDATELDAAIVGAVHGTPDGPDIRRHASLGKEGRPTDPARPGWKSAPPSRWRTRAGPRGDRTLIGRVYGGRP